MPLLLPTCDGPLHGALVAASAHVSAHVTAAQQDDLEALLVPARLVLATASTAQTVVSLTTAIDALETCALRGGLSGHLLQSSHFEKDPPALQRAIVELYFTHNALVAHRLAALTSASQLKLEQLKLEQAASVLQSAEYRAVSQEVERLCARERLGSLRGQAAGGFVDRDAPSLEAALAFYEARRAEVDGEEAGGAAEAGEEEDAEEDAEGAEDDEDELTFLTGFLTTRRGPLWQSLLAGHHVLVDAGAVPCMVTRGNGRSYSLDEVDEWERLHGASWGAVAAVKERLAQRALVPGVRQNLRGWHNADEVQRMQAAMTRALADAPRVQAMAIDETFSMDKLINALESEMPSALPPALAELRHLMQPVLPIFEAMGQLRDDGAALGDALPLALAAALANHLVMEIDPTLGLPQEQPASVVEGASTTRKYCSSVVEGYVHHDGRSGGTWPATFRRLDNHCRRKEQRFMWFARSYGCGNYTTCGHIMSSDGCSSKQILIGAAVRGTDSCAESADVWEVWHAMIELSPWRPPQPLPFTLLRFVLTAPSHHSGRGRPVSATRCAMRLVLVRHTCSWRRPAVSQRRRSMGMTLGSASACDACRRSTHRPRLTCSSCRIRPPWSRAR